MKKIAAFIKENKQFTIFTVLALIVVFVAVFADVIAPMDPTAATLSDAFMAPSAAHPWGTDQLGRDVMSRVIYGTRISLSASLVLVAAIFLIGTILGSIAGFCGGAVDAIIMRISDMMISFPGMVLAIAVAGLMGASITNAIIALMVVSWTKYARLARSLVLKIRHSDFIEAAEVTGTKPCNIIMRYLIPNALPTLVITAATDIGSMILELAGLSFLGFGAQPPASEWGLMLNEGRAYLLQCPWLMIFPGLAICITVIVFNLLGDSLRDVLDPRQKRSAAAKKAPDSRDVLKEAALEGEAI